MDDIDVHRCKPGLASGIITDLQWLGLRWDGDMVWQSRRLPAYEEALAFLIEKDLAYPCFCSRKELRSIASAPHLQEPVYRYSGKCAALSPVEREILQAMGRQCSWRLRCPAKAVAFDDLIQGSQGFTPQEYGGDFVIKRADNVWAYQLVTVIDDAASGINLVLRGSDLLPSTAPQILLHQALNLPVPAYAHIPLLLNEQGERLAKRHQSLSLAAMRAGGIAPEMVIGFLANLLRNIRGPVKPVRPEALLADFNLSYLPRENIVVSQAMLQTFGLA